MKTWIASLCILSLSRAVFSQTCVTPDGPCVFPFVFLGTTYNECTMDGSTQLWCATSVDSTTLNYETYSYCPSSCSNSTVLACQTVDGINCVFPFTFQGTQFDNCTNTAYGSTFWCATSVGAGNVTNSFGTCSSNCPSTSGNSTNVCNTSSGTQCVFPFIYKGLTFTSCTTMDSSFPWCATAVNTNQQFENSYGYCNADCEVATT
ncbi:matrix metalloproteinase-9 [Lepeophtheirus salmonis]|uniref:matrix metalloproteinase-9 n=1 Tax=Lepeophtheirus salmonis TaxID=72036 RepID=UPI001AE97D1C|nr:72 kDa type IV collagenase-like isoform X2 [Lepeophtheirus salmonis]